jgi:glutamate-1-semialdehyde 2,1-aminomutase
METMENKNKEFLSRLENSIPGGAHTYSKGSDQYPENAPTILSHGKGAYVFDIDGNKYLDYGMGLKSVVLGYNYKKVSRAAIKALKLGNNLSKPSLIELEAAEKMISLIPGAEMVKFAKNGSNVTTAAIKMARAYNRRKYVCVPTQQPFFSFDDWFIGSTQLERGVPYEHSSLTLKFEFNNIGSLNELFELHPGEISAVILEPSTHISPCSIKCQEKGANIHACVTCSNIGENFLSQVEQVCKRNDAVLIFDEMRTGFRWDIGGAQKYFGIKPDLSTFGKAIANGFSLAALVGKKEIMDLAGIKDSGAERTFLLSSTHGAEMSSLGAFLATADIFEKEQVSSHLWKYGSELKKVINTTSKELGIESYFHATGPDVCFELTANGENMKDSNSYKTLFLQEMVRNRVLMTFIAPSFSHKEKELEITSNAVKNSLKIYADALNFGIEKYLVGQPTKPVFRKYN